MCRRGGNAGPLRLDRLGRVACALLLWMLPAPGMLQAQAGGESLVLEPRTRRELIAIQNSWIDWLASLQHGEIEQSEQLVDLMLGRAESLGMDSLPDLSAAAAIRASSFASAGDYEKAAAALEAAERLQAESPEVPFAAMRIARSRGNVATAAFSWGQGVFRALSSPTWRDLALGNALLWLAAILTLSAFSFVGLMMAAHGGLLLEDLTDFIGRSLPLVLAHLFVLGLLIWPALLPSGLLWLAVYWSVLLWGYGSLQERVALILLWVVIGGLPVVVSESNRRVDLALSAPMRAIGDAAEGRLTGSLFTDLGVVDDLIGGSVALEHLKADLHLRLRQWERARSLYRRVLAAEPENVAALADIGVAHFHEGDPENAIRYLQRAADSGEASAEVYFSLSRALSEEYRFGESEAMLRTANTLDSRRVGEWIREGPLDPVVTVSGGLVRRAEIEEQLARAWRSVEAEPVAVWNRMLSVPLAVVLVGPAIGVFLLSRRRRTRLPARSDRWFDGSLERLRAALVPGLVETERRKPFRAWLAVTVLLALASVPFFRDAGLSMPPAYEPSQRVAAVIALVALVLYLVVRWLREGRVREAGS